MTPKQLEKLKPGAVVGIAEGAKKYWNEHAFEDCALHTKATSSGYMIDTDEHAIDYFIRKAIANGLPYTATFRRWLPDVGEGRPGASLEISVGPFKDITILSHENLTLIGPHLNRNYKTHRHIAKEA
jgi:hypothetical protein